MFFAVFKHSVSLLCHRAFFGEQGGVVDVFYGSHLLAYGRIHGDQRMVWDALSVVEGAALRRTDGVLWRLELSLLLGDGDKLLASVAVLPGRMVRVELSCADVSRASS